MSDLDWNRQWEIFHRALELAPDERAEFVAGECGDDDVLAAAVMALLETHEGADEFLEQPMAMVSEAIDALDPEALIGQQVDNYVIESVVGEGGMGVVYEAEQLEPVRRRVALKVIRLGMNSEEVVRRFERERQSLAVMNHPNIAQVYDAGVTTDGRPYFVMEFVPGEPLTTFCDRRRLSIRQRARLFQEICKGIQHAHQKGIIHRDIKPSNVIVDRDENGATIAKIIDFGIAKATEHRAAEKTLFTQQGLIIGTPAYMSPEQATLSGAEIDTRSDIYSLSVLLYELLSGALPFENQTLLSAGYAEMQRIIREEDPPKPSTRLSAHDPTTVTRVAELRHSSSSAIRRELSGDLDWIIMKGLEKDPARRYASVAALADDIQRYLDDEPVVARPPGAVYRAAKFVRRHKLGVAVATVVTIMAAVFVVYTVLQSRELAAALGVAEQEQAKAEQVSSFLVELLTEADPNVAQGEAITVRDALERGAEKIGESLEGQPDVRFAVLVQMGGLYRQLGLYERAGQLFDQAEAMAGEIVDNVAASKGELNLAVANLQHDEGRYDEAEASYLEGLTLLNEAHDDHADLVAVLNDLGTLYLDKGDYEAAEDYQNQSLAMSRRLYPGDNPNTANAMQGLGYTLMLAGDLEPAGPLFAETIAMNRRLYGERSNQVATSLNYQAIYLRRSGDFDAAVDALEESLSIYEDVHGPEHPFVATNLSNLANAAAAAGRYDAAEDYARRSIDVYESIFDGPHPNLSTAYYVLASIRSAQGDFAGAESAFRETLAIDRGMLDADHPRIFMNLEQIAVAVKNQGRLDEAETLQREVLAGRLATVGEAHNSTANALINLSSILGAQGELDEAEEHARRAVEILEPIEPDTPRMMGARSQLGYVLYEKEEYEASEQIYVELLEAQRETLPAGHPDIARSLHGIGIARLARGLPAVEILEEALAIREAALGPDHAYTEITRQALEVARQ